MISNRIRDLKAYKTETTKCKIRLSSNELSFSIPDNILNSVLKNIGEEDVRLYPDPSCGELKEAISEFFEVPVENIVLGNGSDELLYYISSAVGTCNGGVYIPVPTFPMYSIISTVTNKRIFEDLLNDNFDIDRQRSNKILDDSDIEISYFAYPNNPTGNLFSREAIFDFIEKGVFVVVDEAYFNYSKDSFLKEALSRDNVVVLRTLSKIGMAGLRIGVMIAREDVVKEMEKVRLPFNVSSFSQKVAVELLKTAREYIEYAVNTVIEERERLFKEMSLIEGVIPFKSKANFILFKTPYDANLIHKKLIEEDVLIRDVSYMPMLDRCLRVTVGTPEENDIFLEKLNKVMNSLQ